jgi:hypothetical protein
VIAVERISFLDAYWRLEQQTGGVLPPETLDASWFSNDDGHMLAAIVRDARDLTWRYFVFKRAGQDAPYARIAAGQDIIGFAAARVAMERDASSDIASYTGPP